MGLSIDQIVELYRTAGRARYGMEVIDQERHAMQCALLAQAAAGNPELIAAALLHDIGHLLADAWPQSAAHKDDLHEYRGLPLLRGEYPAEVLEPIRLHVAAKRYLCATQPAYFDGLSAASRHSLALQGGPFAPQEAADFIAQPHAVAAVALRRWDDQAKSPTQATPAWDHWRAILERARLPIHLRRVSHAAAVREKSPLLLQARSLDER